VTRKASQYRTMKTRYIYALMLTSHLCKCVFVSNSYHKFRSTAPVSRILVITLHNLDWEIMYYVLTCIHIYIYAYIILYILSFHKTIT